MADNGNKPNREKQRQKRPGQGRKPKESTLFKEAQRVILDSHPETVRLLITKAHGIARKIKCPHCGQKFDYKVGDGVDKELLQHLDNRVQGKPTNRIEADIKQDISSSQMLRWYNEIMAYQSEMTSISVEEAHEKVKALPMPEKTGEDEAIEAEYREFHSETAPSDTAPKDIDSLEKAINKMMPREERGDDDVFVDVSSNF